MELPAHAHGVLFHINDGLDDIAILLVRELTKFWHRYIVLHNLCLHYRQYTKLPQESFSKKFWWELDPTKHPSYRKNEKSAVEAGLFVEPLTCHRILNL